MALQLDRYPEVTYDGSPPAVSDLEDLRLLRKWEAAIGYRILAAMLTIWSVQSVSQSEYNISMTGRSPVAAAPTPASRAASGTGTTAAIP